MMTGTMSATPQSRHGASPAVLALFAIWIFWGFGIETLGTRLLTEIDGVVISKQEMPRRWYIHGSGTIYVLRGTDGAEHQYVSGATDASLRNDMPVGTHLTKHKWELSYFRDDIRVDDFPLVFYVAMLSIAIACLFWAGLQWVHRRHA